MPHTPLPHDHGHNIPAHIPDSQAFQNVAAVFKLLDDGTRLRLFWILCHCEECVTNLSVMMGMSSPALSHHLRQLKQAGLIISRRDGKEVYYKADANPTADALHSTLETVMAITCPNL